MIEVFNILTIFVILIVPIITVLLFTKAVKALTIKYKDWEMKPSVNFAQTSILKKGSIYVALVVLLLVIVIFAK